MRIPRENSKENLTSTIPPIFHDRHQKWLYEYYGPPPIELPVNTGEIDIYPRALPPHVRETLNNDLKLRRRFYQPKISELSRNARVAGRGRYTFIIKPETMDDLLETISGMKTHKNEEVRRVLWDIYYLGKTAREAESKVSGKTLTRHLIAAERTLEVMSIDQLKDMTIGVHTIMVSHRILRYARDALIDIRPFFRGRIF